LDTPFRKLRPQDTVVSFGAGQPGTFSLSTITAGLPQNLTSIGLSVINNVTGDR
jgi:hypothetical protein